MKSNTSYFAPTVMLHFLWDGDIILILPWSYYYRLRSIFFLKQRDVQNKLSWKMKATQLQFHFYFLDARYLRKLKVEVTSLCSFPFLARNNNSSRSRHRESGYKKKHEFRRARCTLSYSPTWTTVRSYAIRADARPVRFRGAFPRAAIFHLLLYRNWPKKSAASVVYAIAIRSHDGMRGTETDPRNAGMQRTDKITVLARVSKYDNFIASPTVSQAIISIIAIFFFQTRYINSPFVHR